MTVPARFIGAWRRTGLVIDGAPVGADGEADVLWLQASEWYADLRVPVIDDGGPVEAFAGPARWDEPTFTWEHHVDWLATFPSDEGTFEPVGGDLVERGSFRDGGRAVPYEELWTRAAPETGFVVATVASAAGRAVLVEIGPHRLVLVDGRVGGGAFAARRDERGVDGWETTFARGADVSGGTAIPDLRDVVLGDVITIGAWTLTVTDVRPSAP